MTPPPDLAPGILDFPVDPGVSRYRELLLAARASKYCPVLLDPEVAHEVGGILMPADPIGASGGTEGYVTLAHCLRGVGDRRGHLLHAESGPGC